MNNTRTQNGNNFIIYTHDVPACQNVFHEKGLCVCASGLVVSLLFISMCCISIGIKGAFRHVAIFSSGHCLAAAF